MKSLVPVLISTHSYIKCATNQILHLLQAFVATLKDTQKVNNKGRLTWKCIFIHIKSFVYQVSCHENIPLSPSSSPSCPVSVICSFVWNSQNEVPLSARLKPIAPPPFFSCSGTFFLPSMCTFQMSCTDQQQVYMGPGLQRKSSQQSSSGQMFCTHQQIRTVCIHLA